MSVSNNKITEAKQTARMHRLVCTFVFRKPLRMRPKFNDCCILNTLKTISVRNINHLHQSKEECKGQKSIQSSTTPDLGHHMRKWQNYKKTSHTRKPRDQRQPKMARAFLFYILMAHDVSLEIVKHGQIVGIRLLMLVSFAGE